MADYVIAPTGPPWSYDLGKKKKTAKMETRRTRTTFRKEAANAPGGVDI